MSHAQLTRYCLSSRERSPLYLQLFHPPHLSSSHPPTKFSSIDLYTKTMNRLRNFLSGTPDDDDYPVDPNNESHNNNPSWNSKYGYNKNNRTSKQLQQDDDLYLSDDDDWGMSAFSPTQNSLRETDRYDGEIHRPTAERRGSSSAFWDQTSMDGLGGDGSGGGDGGARGMETSSTNKRGGRGLHEWEREAITRDGQNDDFEIGDDDDDDYHPSDNQRGSTSLQELEESDAYADVREDIRDLEEDDNSSSASSTKEEVVNAYRDYLKSIRDGGFESYLDTDEGEQYETPDFDNIIGTSTHGGGDDEDEALERVLDIEEERKSGALYGDLYGVNDMRATTSPYSAWRVKAKALLQQEEERERSASPSRKMLNRFRRNRSNNVVGTPQRGHVESRDDRGVTEKLYSYRLALFQHPKFRGACVAICLLLALAAGLSYYGEKDTDEEEMLPDLSIPPKSNDGSSSPNMNEQTNSKNLHSGQSDAIVNALETFDPIWYDRRSGWEGITFTDAVNFCLSREDRVPCPYEIYCNQAADGPPYRGNRPNGEQWAAISNGANQWVQVGDMFTCQRYTDLHDHKKPDWGITGISVEHEHGAGGITQNVMCCEDLYNIGSLDPFTEWGKQDKLDHVEADSTEETTDSAVVNVQDAESEKNPNEGDAAVTSQNMDAQKREKAVIAAFQPIWFSSAHGWAGTSYEDAILFCESYNHMVLCPYAAYCPNGNSRAALPGSMLSELDGEEWVPANGPMNTWLQIGTIDGDESTRCTLHHELLGERPQWGIDGSRTDVKHFILCAV